jgi:hypothetical protein
MRFRSTLAIDRLRRMFVPGLPVSVSPIPGGTFDNQDRTVPLLGEEGKGSVGGVHLDPGMALEAVSVSDTDHDPGFDAQGGEEEAGGEGTVEAGRAGDAASHPLREHDRAVRGGGRHPHRPPLHGESVPDVVRDPEQTPDAHPRRQEPSRGHERCHDQEVPSAGGRPEGKPPKEPDEERGCYAM